MNDNFKFLRGARLLQWSEDDLIEVTLQDLERDTVFGFPNTTKRNTQLVRFTLQKLN